MHVRYSLLASQATTALFVLLWGSAAIFTRWGLDNASPMALLVFRFLVALVALAPLAPPAPASLVPRRAEPAETILVQRVDVSASSSPQGPPQATGPPRRS